MISCEILFLIDPSSDPFANNDRTYFFMIYGVLCIFNSIFALIRAFLFAIFGVLAGKRIHKNLIQNLAKVMRIKNKKILFN